MTLEEFQIKRTDIISNMLDNPDKYGIYPTTKCYEELDFLFLTSKIKMNKKIKELEDRLTRALALCEWLICEVSSEIRNGARLKELKKALEE